MIKLLLGASLACVLGIFGTLWATRNLSPAMNLQELPSVRDCISSNLSTLKFQTLQTDQLRDVSKLCFEQITYQGTLNDFQMRRFPYLQQYNSNPVLLWMVVIITFSGVVLAGVQLLAAFQLGQNLGDQQTSMSIEGNKFVLQSSVTGILILVVSFAFFIVFVRYVYKIDVVDPDQTSAQGRPLLQSGGLGLPPPQTVP
jgi:hypothetical protein